MSFFVRDPWTTELHEMNEKCFQMLKSLFSHDCMVFLSRRYHTPLPERENCPFWLWRNWPGHLSNTQRQRMTIENLILDGQVHTLFSENKAMSKLLCQR